MDQRLKNKDWRISHLYLITNKQNKLIQFKRNKTQEELNKNKHSRNIILKSRQLGLSTYEAVDMLDDCLFTRNFNGLFIAQDLDTAKDIFANKIDLAWRNFSLKQLYQVNNDSARQIKFDFGDNTFSSITVDNTGRSGTFSRVHVTEFAVVCNRYFEKAREIIEGTIPAVPINGRIDIESTAEGSDGFFHDMFWESWNKQQQGFKPESPLEFKAHFFNWTYDVDDINSSVPYDVPLEFKEYQKKHNLTDKEISYYYQKWLSLNRDWEALRRQYPTTPDEAFTYSGNKLFNQEIITDSRRQIVRGIKDNDWIFYEPYRKGHRYGIGCDVAEGVGQDSSTAVIWDFTPVKPKTVAVYRNNKISPDLFASDIVYGANKYNQPIIAVERNNHGHTTLSKLREIYPENLIYIDSKGKYGWETNLITKPRMMYDLATAFNDNFLEVLSPLLLSEMQMYDKEELRTVRFDPERTRHFDLLIAAAIGLQMKNELLKSREVITYRPSWSENKKNQEVIKTYKTLW